VIELKHAVTLIFIVAVRSCDVVTCTICFRRFFILGVFDDLDSTKFTPQQLFGVLADSLPRFFDAHVQKKIHYSFQ